MSFNIDFNKPIITNAQASQDGGAGNLGYMKGGGQQNSKKQESSNSIFDEQKDSFISSTKKEETLDEFIDRMILTFKCIIRRLFHYCFK
jgi:hypothetical protein